MDGCRRWDAVAFTEIHSGIREVRGELVRRLPNVIAGLRFRKTFSDQPPCANF